MAPSARASDIARPRSRTSCVTCRTLMLPAAAMAAYSPTLCPTTTSGVTPSRSSTARSAASDVATSAGCVSSVRESSSSGAWKHSSARSKPSSSDASS